MPEQGNENGAARRRHSAKMTGVRKAAVLLVAVGEALAKEILRALPEADVQLLTEELADLRGITPEMSCRDSGGVLGASGDPELHDPRGAGLRQPSAAWIPSARSAPTTC